MLNLARGGILLTIISMFCVLPARGQDVEMKTLILELKSEVLKLTNRVSALEQELKEERAKREEMEASANTFPDNEIQSEPRAKSKTNDVDSGTQKIAAPIYDSNTTKPELEPVVAGDAKGTYKIPGTNTSVGFGGYVKLDAIYNSVSAGNNHFSDQLYFPGLVPLRRADEGDNLTFSPRESRIWFKSLTPTTWGDMSTYVELDFYAFQSPGNQIVSNSYAPRMRHAYGTIGSLLVGQTWSTFMNVSALPELLDFGAPAGRIFIRQPLLRWTQPFTIGGNVADLQLALEQPESLVVFPDGTTLEMDDDRAPDSVVRLNFNPFWGTFSLAGMVRQIRYADKGAHSNAWGGAISLGGKVKTSGLDNFSFHASYGNALGRYTSFGAFADGIINDQGSVRLYDVFAGFAAYQHWWNEAWRSSIAYGYAAADNPHFAPGTVNDWVHSAHINLLWSPFIQTTFGLEYMFATRKTQNGATGDLQRVMFSSKFNF